LLFIDKNNQLQSKMEQLSTKGNAKRKLTFNDEPNPLEKKQKKTLPNLESVAGSVVLSGDLLVILECLVYANASEYRDYILSTSPLLERVNYGLYLISLREIQNIIYGTNKQ